MEIKARTRVAFILPALMLASACFAQTPPAGTQPAKLSKQDQAEVDAGQKAVAEIEKEGKIVKDPAVLERVQRIGAVVAAVARTKAVKKQYGVDRLSPFDYQFHVIQDDDVNAFSLPGGFIYVNTGLLKFVESDDELAAVLAHECAHAAHHHLIKLQADANKISTESLLVAVALVLATGHPMENAGNVANGMMLYQIARTNAYSQEAEADADHTGYFYAKSAGYNPVGFLTFEERLFAHEQMEPDITLGILQTHPPTHERAEAIIKLLNEDHIPIKRSEVSTTARVQQRQVTDGGKQMIEVYSGRIVLGRLAADASTRVVPELMSTNQLLDSGLLLYEVSSAPGSVTARGKTLIQITSADATANNTSVEALTKQFYEGMKRAVSLVSRLRTLVDEPDRTARGKRH